MSLLEGKKKRQQQKLKEIAAIEKLKRLKDKVKILKKLLLLKFIARIANLNFLDLELLANLG